RGDERLLRARLLLEESRRDQAAPAGGSEDHAQRRERVVPEGICAEAAARADGGHEEAVGWVDLVGRVGRVGQNARLTRSLRPTRLTCPTRPTRPPWPTRPTRRSPPVRSRERANLPWPSAASAAHPAARPLPSNTPRRCRSR